MVEWRGVFVSVMICFLGEGEVRVIICLCEALHQVVRAIARLGEGFSEDTCGISAQFCLMEWRGKVLDMGKPLKADTVELSFRLISVEPFRFLECIFSQCSISAPLPSIAKWRQTEKEEEIEQNPHFIPSFHSPTLIPTTLLCSIGSLKEVGEKGIGLLFRGVVGVGGNVIVSAANLSPIDPLLEFLLSFLVCR
ncbi:hypothetical protein CDAR_381771 [Caerostris darwini]|uniref:Uncharacterized protein n=1 Tax=Caerostris darwini TaxID=1538125 RepID=A0AAV4V553_9ARAC|nr:hypothetical protein CDAR_381771 [Caerostris darwini]